MISKEDILKAIDKLYPYKAFYHPQDKAVIDSVRDELSTVEFVETIYAIPGQIMVIKKEDLCPLKI